MSEIAEETGFTHYIDALTSTTQGFNARAVYIQEAKFKPFQTIRLPDTSKCKYLLRLPVLPTCLKGKLYLHPSLFSLDVLNCIPLTKYFHEHVFSVLLSITINFMRYRVYKYE